MLSRIHSQTDVLKNGKIMLLIENDSDCQTLTDLEYAEYALKEILVCNYKAIQEITASKNNVSLGNYIDMLTSLTNNLKIITESLLALKIKTSNPNTKSSTISESLLKEIVKMNQTAQEDRKNALNQIEKICNLYDLKMDYDPDGKTSNIFLPAKDNWFYKYPELEKIMDKYTAYSFCKLVFPDSTAAAPKSCCLT